MLDVAKGLGCADDRLMIADKHTHAILRAALSAWIIDSSNGYSMAGLNGQTSAIPYAQPLERDDTAGWKNVIDLARSCKCTGLLPRGLQLAGFVVPDSILSDLKAQQAAVARSNHLNLAFTLKAVSALSAGDVTSIVLKGPLRSYPVYGNWGIRQSKDVDLLVPKSDYQRAITILEDAGYECLVDQRSRWWPDWLGELPFRKRDGSGPIIDLHHQVQQPGGPFPRSLDDVFVSSRECVQGGVAYRLPSQEMELLVSAISYGKAVQSRTGWLHHVHELALSFSQLPPDKQAEVRRHANRQGLERLLADALAQSEILFATTSPNVSDADFDMVDSATINAMGRKKSDRSDKSRTRHLWDWTDGSGLRRSWRVLARSIHVHRSDWVRGREARRGLFDA